MIQEFFILTILVTCSTNVLYGSPDNVEYIYFPANGLSHYGYDLTDRSFVRIVDDINGNEDLKNKRQWAFPHKRQWAFPHKRQWSFPH